LIIYLYDSTRAPACLDHEHETIVTAIESGDAASAEREIAGHIDHVLASLHLKEEAVEAIDLEKIFA